MCGAETGKALGHSWQEASCTEPSFCLLCGLTFGNPNGHVPSETRIITAPQVFEPGEEELICGLCGEVIGTRPCELTSYADGDGFVFTVRDYKRLAIDAKSELMPDTLMVVMDDDDGNECITLWDKDSEGYSVKAAVGTLEDAEGNKLSLSDGEDEKPALVLWNIRTANERDYILQVLELILRTASPAPADASELYDSGSLMLDGISFVLEGTENGYTLQIFAGE